MQKLIPFHIPKIRYQKTNEENNSINNGNNKNKILRNKLSKGG